MNREQVLTVLDYVLRLRGSRALTNQAWQELNSAREAIASAMADVERFTWRPIDSAPVGKTMILVIGITRDDGKPYVSDPYCVWQASPGKFTRWPHEFFGPTHWMPLPEAPK